MNEEIEEIELESESMLIRHIQQQADKTPDGKWAHCATCNTIFEPEQPSESAEGGSAKESESGNGGKAAGESGEGPKDEGKGAGKGPVKEGVEEGKRYAESKQ